MNLKNILPLALLLVCVACSDALSEQDNLLTEPVETPDEASIPNIEYVLSKAEEQAAVDLSEFSSDFFKALCAGEGADKNVVASPSSAAIFLSMLANTSKPEAAQEIYSALGTDDIETLNTLNQKILGGLPSKDAEVTLNFANSLWYEQSFWLNPKKSKILSDIYFAELYKKDIKNNSANVANEINDWVSDKTNGLIPSILNGLDSSIGAVLINAQYFNGLWTKPFASSKTVSRQFNGTNATSWVKMMHSNAEQNYFCDESKTIIKKTFGKSEAFCACFVLPAEGVGVDDLIEEDIISEALRVNYTKAELDLYLPKFEVITKDNISLNKPLKDLGITKAMNMAYSDLLNCDMIGYSDIKQKVSLKFDETGAEAAAITFAELHGMGIPHIKAEVKFDRPFIFTINETSTGLCLFAGKINNL